MFFLLDAMLFSCAPDLVIELPFKIRYSCTVGGERMNDRNGELRREIIRTMENIESTEYLLRIRRLVRWCAGKGI